MLRDRYTKGIPNVVKAAKMKIEALRIGLQCDSDIFYYFFQDHIEFCGMVHYGYQRFNLKYQVRLSRGLKKFARTFCVWKHFLETERA